MIDDIIPQGMTYNIIDVSLSYLLLFYHLSDSAAETQSSSVTFFFKFLVSKVSFILTDAPKEQKLPLFSVLFFCFSCSLLMLRYVSCRCVVTVACWEWRLRSRVFPVTKHCLWAISVPWCTELAALMESQTMRPHAQIGQNVSWVWSKGSCHIVIFRAIKLKIVLYLAKTDLLNFCQWNIKSFILNLSLPVSLPEHRPAPAGCISYLL